MSQDDRLFEENERTAPVAEGRAVLGIGDLTLEVGGVLPQVEVAYETWGAPRNPAVLVCHALSGDSHAVGWWERVVGPGKAVDTDRYFVVCSNALGGCQGTTGPASLAPDGEPWGTRFPAITVRDMVSAQARLADALGIEKWALVCGGSMGGMQALDWARAFPGRVERLWMTASCAAHSAMQIGFNEAGRQAILRDPVWVETGKSFHGLSVARMIGHLTYLSHASFDAKFGRRLQGKSELSYDGGIEFQVESYLNYQGDKFTGRFDAGSYLVLTRAIDYFDGSNVDDVTADVLLTSYTSDWIYPSEQSDRLYGLLSKVTRCEHHVIDLPYGHDSFLLDGEHQGKILDQFMNMSS